MATTPQQTNRANVPKANDYGFLDSLLILFVSCGLTLLLLFLASRVAGNTTFEQLPEWVKSTYTRLFTTLVSGGSLATLTIKAIRNKSGANFLLSIAGTTIAILVIIMLLAHMMTPKPKPPVPEPGPLKSWHKQNEQNQDYFVDWDPPGNCEGVVNDAGHNCQFVKAAQPRIPGQDYFDHWALVLRAPGPVWEVTCQPNLYQLNEVTGQTAGTPDGTYGRCGGWINKSKLPVHMVVKYSVWR